MKVKEREDASGKTYVPAVVTSCCHNRWERARPETAFNPATNKDELRCRLCGGVASKRRVKLEGWHFRDSQRYMKSQPLIWDADVTIKGEKVPTGIPEPALRWFEFAHSEQYKYTDRMHSLRKIVNNNIFLKLSETPEVIEGAGKTLAKTQNLGLEEQLKKITSVIQYIAEMSRRNLGEDTRVERKSIAVILGVAPPSVRPKITSSKLTNGNGKTSASTAKAAYEPPLCKFANKVIEIIEGYDRWID